jgi:hypothetical protein
MRDFRELNQQVSEVKRVLNSFIQKLTAQVEKCHRLLHQRIIFGRTLNAEKEYHEEK